MNDEAMQKAIDEANKNVKPLPKEVPLERRAQKMERALKEIASYGNHASSMTHMQICNVMIQIAKEGLE